MELQFFGAVRNVTGSMHLVTTGDRRILLDCGLHQGKRRESIEKNRNFPFDPASVDVLVLSHAHIDHSGNIPLLVKNGFTGHIFCTHATQDLVNVMLRDSAHIQEKDAEFISKRHREKGLPPVEPLYTAEDAERCTRHFVGIAGNRPFPVCDGVRLTFLEAGHVFGSAVVALDIEEDSETRKVVFTGDLGRKNLPVIRNPEPVKEADVYITESTYGNRLHEPVENMKAKLQQVVSETVRKGGKVIVPSFALGRTQELVYTLHELFNEKKLPEIPIFVDSPLAVNITEVFRLHPECFDRETHEAFLGNNQDPFGFYRLRYIRHTEESMELNTLKDPCIIISASGMCEAGRILHHLANNITNPLNTILIVGFMAENTLGRRLAEKQPVVKILGEDMPLKARVVSLNGFSAHADQKELLDYFGHLNRDRLQQVFIVHGESEASETLEQRIRGLGFDRVTIPVEGKKYAFGQS